MGPDRCENVRRHDLRQKRRCKGLRVLGSGPEVASARFRGLKRVGVCETARRPPAEKSC